ncbi:MAG: heparan-alpha-glucosaminide N-acetyltransferase domain-containing protein [Prevotella sp.]|nr:heparan-alpha-glucosaminide N-acetyltransferase domain-containing protein [Prevotella sp.]
MSGGRLLSLDVLRGATVAAMILVNNAGGSVSFAPLRHAAWNGLTLADLVFPFFLFIAGVSLALSMQKHASWPRRKLLLKIVRRTLLILLAGWLLNAFELFFNGGGLREIRLTGVLPRIAICYFLAAITSLYARPRTIIFIIILVLAVYGAMLVLLNGYCESGDNFLSKTDRLILGANHLYRKSPVDPEGLISTLPAATNTLIGYCCGKYLKVNHLTRKIILSGLGLTFFGLLLSLLLPLNKHVWSPSFVLLSCGLAMLLFALLHFIIETKNRTALTNVFRYYGTNPLALYLLAEMLAVALSGSGSKTTIFSAIRSLIPNEYLASLAYAILFTLAIGAAGFALFKNKIFIKI